jgi:hypothetical protein
MTSPLFGGFQAIPHRKAVRIAVFSAFFLCTLQSNRLWGFTLSSLFLPEFRNPALRLSPFIPFG